jgi:transmembrane sensor
MTSERASSYAGDQRFEQAAQWYLRLRDDLSADELLEWERWFADPENQEALDLVRRMSPVHGRLRRPDLLSAELVQADRYDGSVPVSDWVDQSSAAKGLRRFRGAFPKRAVVSLALAASVAAVALLMTVLRHPWSSDALEPLHVYETRLGEHLYVTLSDGSKITLGALTKVSTHYSPSRRIVLLEGGEALFSVAKNRQRPFTVVAAGGTVTAVGTRFNVRSDLNRVTVTVTEGAVDVEPADTAPTSGVAKSDVASNDAVVKLPRGPHWQPTRLVKGQEVTYDEAQGRGSVAPAPIGATEWLSGRLQYRQVPLKYVAADVQRYFNKSIVLVDNAGNYEFTGTIYQSEVDDWLRALEKIFPVRVSQSDAQILIQSLPGSQSESASSSH